MKATRLAAAVAAVVVAGTAGVLALRPHGPSPNSIERTAAYQDPNLLRQGWALAVARRYGPAGYVYQRNPSTCGPTSVADVLRSEGVPATERSVLRGGGVRTILGVLPGGLTLDREAALLRQATGRPVAVLRGLTLPAFRAEMAASNDPARRYIVNFTRASLFGRGHGHFSPVLGYLPGPDLVLVGDVNASYRPWLVSTNRLYAAQNTIDPATHASRGLLRTEVSAAPVETLPLQPAGRRAQDPVRSKT